MDGPVTQSQRALFRIRSWLASTILRKVVEPVPKKALAGDPAVQAAIRRMREFVDQPENDLVAIAAPQLAYDLKIFVMSSRLFQNSEARLEFGSMTVLNSKDTFESSSSSSSDADTEPEPLVWDAANVPAADDHRLVVVNPVVVKAIGPIVSQAEECISIPKYQGIVPRYSALDVEYLSATGELIQGRFHRAAARVFQHELDHLYGRFSSKGPPAPPSSSRPSQ